MISEPKKNIFSSYALPDLILLCILSAIFLFFRLGSFSMPQTEYHMDSADSSREIILDLGNYTDLAELQVFLGHSPGNGIAFSYFDEMAGEWVVLQSDTTIQSAFTWNRIEIGARLRYLGIVETGGAVSMHEMVLRDYGNNVLLPVNAADYPELFDEQDQFPEYTTYYEGSYFDEVYYATTAYQLRHGIYPIETTHPHLGKYLITLGTMVFGNVPFGWRVVVALFGVLLNIPVYLLTEKLTGKRFFAILAVALMNFDFMHYTLARICTIDSIVAFFILCLFYAMYMLVDSARKDLHSPIDKLPRRTMFWILFSSVSLACAVTTKWTGIYAGVSVAVYFLVNYLSIAGEDSKKKAKNRSGHYLRQLFWTTGLCHVLFTAVLYLLSYIPYARIEGKSFLQEAYDLNTYSLRYHANVSDAHSYSSKWYQWPFTKGTLLDSFSGLADGKVSEISTLGNPVIWWGGLIALVLLLILRFKQKDKKAGYLCFLYFCMYAPWIMISRTVFIYQYYLCSLLICIMLAYAFSLLKENKKYLPLIYLGAALLVLIFAYPVISGQPMSYTYLARLQKVFPWWRIT